MRTVSETSGTTIHTTKLKSYGSQNKKTKVVYEKIFEDILVENFHKMGKGLATQFQETQRLPHMINLRRNVQRYTLIKLTKLKHKGKKNKGNKGKATNNTQGDPHKDKS